MYSERASGNPVKLAKRRLVVANFRDCMNVVSLPSLTLNDSDPVCEERMMLANGQEVMVVEGQANKRHKVLQAALDLGMSFEGMVLGTNVNTRQLLASFEGWNMDLCCIPDTFLGWDVKGLMPKALRLTLSLKYQAQRHSQYAPFPLIKDEDGAMECAYNVTRDVLKLFPHMVSRHVQVYKTTGDRGKFWMMMLLFKELSKAQKAAHKAWATIRARSR